MNFAAWTYSRSLTDSDRLRTTRADSIQPKAASSTTSRSQRVRALRAAGGHHRDQQERGDHQQQVDHPQGDPLEPAAEVGGERSDECRDAGGEDGHQEADQQRLPQPAQGQGEHVPAALGGAQQMPVRRWLEVGAAIDWS